MSRLIEPGCPVFYRIIYLNLLKNSGFSNYLPKHNPPSSDTLSAARRYGLTTMQSCLWIESLRQSDLAEARSLSGPVRRR